MQGESYVRHMLNQALCVPGHIEDVARLMITLAKGESRGGIVECKYPCKLGVITLCAMWNTRVADIVRAFEAECRDLRRARGKLPKAS